MVAVEETSTKAMINGFRMAEKMQNEICVVLFKVKNEKFGTKTPAYELKLFGKTLTEWVANAVYDADIKFVECNFKDNFLPFAKDATNINSKYTVVLFSDTPLFERRTFLQIMEYFKMKKLSVLCCHVMKRLNSLPIKANIIKLKLLMICLKMRLYRFINKEI